MFPIELIKSVIPNNGLWREITITAASEEVWDNAPVGSVGFCVGTCEGEEVLLGVNSERCGFSDHEFMYECIGQPEHEGRHFACQKETLDRVPLVVLSVRNADAVAE